MHPPFSVLEFVAIELSSHRSDSDFHKFPPTKIAISIPTSELNHVSLTRQKPRSKPPFTTFHLRHHHHLPSPPTMPKRKLPSSSSPPQPSLKNFLPIRKPLPHPVSKRAKLVSPPPSRQKEEAGPPCPNSPSTDDLVHLFEYIDEVLLFSGKPLLWGHIQEEVFSLHKRFPRPISRVLIVGVLRLKC